MRFRQGDFVGAIDEYGRSVSGVATDNGLGGWVTLQPNLRLGGGVWFQPASVSVRVATCRLIEPAETVAQRRAFQERQHAGRLNGWQRDAALRCATGRAAITNAEML